MVGTVTLSLVLALLAFTTRRFETAPSPDTAIRLMTAEALWLEWRFLGNLSRSIEAKRGELRAKARPLSSSLTTLIAGAVLLGGYLIVDTITSGT